MPLRAAGNCGLLGTATPVDICVCLFQVSALEELWKAAPDAKVEDLDAAEVRGAAQGAGDNVHWKLWFEPLTWC